MLLSSLSICRLVKTFGIKHHGVWVDKSKKDPTLRNCTFRYFDKGEAETVAHSMQSLITSGGFDNSVKITSKPIWNFPTRSTYYVRINARILQKDEK